MARQTSSIEDKNFKDMLFESAEFDFDALRVLDWVEEYFLPEDVFSNEELAAWASDNDFMRDNL